MTVSYLSRTATVCSKKQLCLCVPMSNGQQIKRHQPGILNSGALVVTASLYPPVDRANDYDYGDNISILTVRTRIKGKLANFLWKRINDKRKKSWRHFCWCMQKNKIHKLWCTLEIFAQVVCDLLNFCAHNFPSKSQTLKHGGKYWNVPHIPW